MAIASSLPRALALSTAECTSLSLATANARFMAAKSSEAIASIRDSDEAGLQVEGGYATNEVREGAGSRKACGGASLEGCGVVGGGLRTVALATITRPADDDAGDRPVATGDGFAGGGISGGGRHCVAIRIDGSVELWIVVKACEGVESEVLFTAALS